MLYSIYIPCWLLVCTAHSAAVGRRPPIGPIAHTCECISHTQRMAIALLFTPRPGHWLCGNPLPASSCFLHLLSRCKRDHSLQTMCSWLNSLHARLDVCLCSAIGVACPFHLLRATHARLKTQVWRPVNLKHSCVRRQIWSCTKPPQQPIAKRVRKYGMPAQHRRHALILQLCHPPFRPRCRWPCENRA